MNVCPTTTVELQAASAEQNCTRFKVYHCLRDQNRQLTQKCIKPSWIQAGLCAEYNTIAERLDAKPCKTTQGICPQKAYLSNDVISYSACAPVQHKSVVVLTSTQFPNQVESRSANLKLILPSIIVPLALVMMIAMIILIWFLRRRETHKTNHNNEDSEDKMELIDKQAKIREHLKRESEKLEFFVDDEQSVSVKESETVQKYIRDFLHIVIVGKPGSGKTSLAWNVCKSFHDKRLGLKTCILKVLKKDNQGMQHGKDIQGMQLGEDIQGMQLGEDTQCTQLGEDTQGMQQGEDTQGKQQGEDTQGTQLGVDTQGMQQSEDTQGMQQGEYTQGKQQGEDTQGTQLGEDTQGMQQGEDTQGTQLGENTQGMQQGEDEIIMLLLDNYLEFASTKAAKEKLDAIEHLYDDMLANRRMVLILTMNHFDYRRISHILEGKFTKIDIEPSTTDMANVLESHGITLKKTKQRKTLEEETFLKALDYVRIEKPKFWQNFVPIGFPLIASLAALNDQFLHNFSKFAEKPIDRICDLVWKLVSSDFDDKCRFCTIVYAAFHGGRIDLNSVDEELFNIIAGAHKVTNAVPKTDHYLFREKGSGIFELYHESILRLLLSKYGQVKQEFLVSECPLPVLLKYCTSKKGDGDEREFQIVIEKIDKLKILIRRIKKDTVDIKNYTIWEDERFRQWFSETGKQKK